MNLPQVDICTSTGISMSENSQSAEDTGFVNCADVASHAIQECYE